MSQSPQRQSTTRSFIRRKALDLKAINKSVRKALKPRIGTVKKLAKGFGKGLVIGYVVGLIESYLFNKLAEWVTKDEGIKRLNELEAKKAPEIERRVEMAIEKHVRELRRTLGVTNRVVLEFRLVNLFFVGDIYLPHDLLLDKAYVTDFARSEACMEVGVTPDVTKVGTFHLQEDLFRVFQCTRILDFDYPDVGRPSLEGEWRSFFIDKSEPDKQHLATYTISVSGNGKQVRISGVNAVDNRKLKIFHVEWTGHFLEFRVKHKIYTEHISISFDEWDVLTGMSYLYEGYLQVQSPSLERWERITETEKRAKALLRHYAKALIGKP